VEIKITVEQLRAQPLSVKALEAEHLRPQPLLVNAVEAQHLGAAPRSVKGLEAELLREAPPSGKALEAENLGSPPLSVKALETELVRPQPLSVKALEAELLRAPPLSVKALEAGSAAQGSDLQAAFQKFLKKRKKAQQAGTKQADEFSKQRTSEAFRQKLRQLFVDRVRHYIGVPYAKRFHTPEGCDCEGCTESGRQLYHNLLFLDCCALVRQAVGDLQDMFGFRLGKRNQSYQFDTLPIQVGSVAELEPGDLIFWSGEYFKPKLRRQVFDITHVEVFVGGKTGKGVIGSRQQHKWVMEYDSYVFTSKSWKCKEIFFCKIDTWLMGICTPAHPKLWRGAVRAPVNAEKSIFFSQAEAGAQRPGGHSAPASIAACAKGTGGCSGTEQHAAVAGLGGIPEAFCDTQSSGEEEAAETDDDVGLVNCGLAATTSSSVPAAAERLGGCLVIV